MNASCAPGARFAGGWVAVSMLAINVVVAQPYPAKSIRVVIGGSPGSNADIFFRIVQAPMGNSLGQALVADYRPGAGGSIGAAHTVKSAPDGYTVMMVAAGFVINPALTKNLPYDPARDFSAMGLVADVPAGLVIHPSLPAYDVKQLIAIARARPGQLNFGSAGPGTVSHLAGVLFNLIGQIDTVHVPYKSSGPSLIDLIAGQMAFSFPTVSGALPHVKSGKLRLLAQTGAKRSLLLKDMPTAQEAGLEGFVVNSGFGYVGPGGIPRPIVDAISTALLRTMQDPAVRNSMINNGADPVGSTPEQHDAYLKSEVAKWLRVGRSIGVKRD